MYTLLDLHRAQLLMSPSSCEYNQMFKFQPAGLGLQVRVGAMNGLQEKE